MFHLIDFAPFERDFLISLVQSIDFVSVFVQNLNGAVADVKFQRRSIIRRNHEIPVVESECVFVPDPAARGQNADHRRVSGIQGIFEFSASGKRDAELPDSFCRIRDFILKLFFQLLFVIAPVEIFDSFFFGTVQSRQRGGNVFRAGFRSVIDFRMRHRKFQIQISAGMFQIEHSGFQRIFLLCSEGKQ